jgi:hypothetical protein
MASHLKRFAILPYLLVLAGLFLLSEVRSQPPYELPQGATAEELQQVVVPLSDAVKQRITEALANPAQQGGVGGSSGDPILDDVLNVIRRQGSILDGTSLDESLDRAPLPASGASERLPNRQSSKAGDSADERFFTAECLLKAARKLAALSDGDAQRQRLVAAMREQAAMLMIDEFSQSSIEMR